jgi:UDP-N-acetylmuramoyl-L-alanyl-D-glutamate--2,6-diaminopimelate ligase
MRLGEVIANAARLVRGSPETEISRIVYDSREAGPGSLFCALPGVKIDGQKFARDAVAKGAAAVLSERELEGDFPLVTAPDPRRAMALCAAQFFRMPASRLSMLGVTGTNGKTTTSYLVDQMLRAAGRRTGLIGTVEQRVAGKSRPATHTTPESVELQALLAEMVDAGCELVAMEVSSHALAQSRVVGVRFRAAAFTQLTRDHLDYHQSMESYFDAKAKLFTDHLAAHGTAIIGRDDEWSDRLAGMLAGTERTVWRYAIETPSDIRATGLQLSLQGFSAVFETPMGGRRVKSPLVGEHNVKNALAATGLALAAGVPLNAVVDALAESRGAPGRLESVEDPAGRCVFVDYAHTDDALARVLDALDALKTPEARVICVFGCGGDRDAGKRPLMGAAAAKRAHAVIVTNDNPRTEEPTAIAQQIVPGIEGAGMTGRSVDELARGARGYATILDRAEAIRAALRIARPGDAVLIAGKGHEDYQIVGTEKRYFDDREAAREALRSMR